MKQIISKLNLRSLVLTSVFAGLVIGILTSLIPINTQASGGLCTAPAGCSQNCIRGVTKDGNSFCGHNCGLYSCL